MLIHLSFSILFYNVFQWLSFVVYAETAKRELNLGFLLQYNSNPSSAMDLEAASLVALQELNEKTNLLPEFRVRMIPGSGGCSAIDSVADLGHLICQQNIHAAIGPSCSDGCIPAGYLATYHNLPLISYSCSTIVMKNKTIYPTFARTRPYAREAVDTTSKLLVSFFKDMKWESTAIIYTDDGVWRPLRTEIRKLFSINKLRINIERNFQDGDNITEFEKIMMEMKVRTRIIVMLCSRIDVARMLVIAHKFGMKEGFAYLSLDFDVGLLGNWQEKEWGKGFEEKVFNGLLDVSTRDVVEAGGDRFQYFVMNVTQALARPPYNKSVNASEVYSAVAFIHDAIFSYAYALRKTLDDAYLEHIERVLNDTGLSRTYTPKMVREMSRSLNITVVQHPYNKSVFLNLTHIETSFNITAVLKDGKRIVRNIFNLEFQGVSGPVVIDNLGNRVPILEMRNFRDGFLAVAEFDGTRRGSEYTRFKNRKPFFPGETEEIPDDSPPCGYEKACPDKLGTNTTIVYLAVASACAFIVLLVGGNIFYRRQKYENDLFNKKSFISYKELLSSFKCINTTETSTLTVTDSAKGTSISGSELPGGTKENWGGFRNFTAKYKHNTVYVKRLQKTTVYLNRDILIEIKECRDLRHINLNMFVGVTVESPNICVVWNYCSKGSLRDILSDDEIQLDWIFRLSFTADIAAGMAELHDSPIGIHGNLNSYNVLIDNRWTCKISDFGLDKFRDPKDLSKRRELMDHEKYKTLMWRAPELISMNVHKQTKQGDVYSYGIITSEIVTRMVPYENYGYGFKDIILFVQRHCLPPFRPHCRLESGMDGRILDIMRRCWHDSPQERPNFREIVGLLRTIRKERNDSNNLVDNMLSMMEKYTIHLEKTVHERTDQLEKEKEKVETVLYKMLPKMVAEKLKQGETVRPQTFNSVSILLTDIVDFSTITSKSTALQVVDLLNELYVLFDQTVDKFDCFKVETEGERYIVVSGMPKTNGNRHVVEIASMSLHLMSKIAGFQLKHIDKRQLLLRMAIHTGPCAAGIVGLKMPRYCIFGDAVQFVRHLERTGPPLRIQISPEFKAELDEIGGFHTEIRGPVQVKGRGLVLPFFLTGQDGLDVELPIPEEDHGVPKDWDRNLIPKLQYTKSVRTSDLPPKPVEPPKPPKPVEPAKPVLVPEKKDEPEKTISKVLPLSGLGEVKPLMMMMMNEKVLGRQKAGLGYSRRRVIADH